MYTTRRRCGPHRRGTNDGMRLGTGMLEVSASDTTPRHAPNAARKIVDSGQPNTHNS